MDRTLYATTSGAIFHSNDQISSAIVLTYANFPRIAQHRYNVAIQIHPTQAAPYPIKLKLIPANKGPNTLPQEAAALVVPSMRPRNSAGVL